MRASRPRRESMKTMKRKQPTGPRGTRPRMPAIYGVPRDEKGLLPWSHVTERLAKAKQYWVCTAGADGRPHATPVDGLWLDDRLWFGGSVETRRHRNLAENPSVCVHLDDAMDVVILYGDAEEVRVPERALCVRLAEESKKKYCYGFSADDYAKTPGVFVLRPRKVLAWKNFPKDATRWRFD